MWKTALLAILASACSLKSIPPTISTTSTTLPPIPTIAPEGSITPWGVRREVHIPLKIRTRTRNKQPVARAALTASALCGLPHVTLQVGCRNSRSIVTGEDPLKPIPIGELATCTVFVGLCATGDMLITNFWARNQICNMVTGDCTDPPLAQRYAVNLLWDLAPGPLTMAITERGRIGNRVFTSYPMPVKDGLVLGPNEKYVDMVELSMTCIDKTTGDTRIGCGAGTTYFAVIEVE